MSVYCTCCGKTYYKGSKNNPSQASTIAIGTMPLILLRGLKAYWSY